jgi:hypothetical protein
MSIAQPGDASLDCATEIAPSAAHRYTGRAAIMALGIASMTRRSSAP